MNFLLKGATFAQPSTLYIALFTSPPLVSGTGGIEVSLSSTGYARVPIQCNSSNWIGPDSNMLYQTVNDVVFNVPTGNWGTVTAIGLFTAPTGGDLYFIGNLATPRSVSAGEGAPKFAAGNLKFSPVR